MNCKRCGKPHGGDWRRWYCAACRIARKNQSEAQKMAMARFKERRPTYWRDWQRANG